MKRHVRLNSGGSGGSGGCGRLAIVLVTALMLAAGSLASPAGAQTPWRFIAVGDTRSSSSTAVVNSEIMAELAQEIVSQNARFVIVPGDLVYSGSAAAFQQWKDLMAPVYRAGIPVLPVMGNHDANAVAAWTQAFGADIPDNGPAGELDRTYYFTHEGVLVLALDQYVTTGKVNQAWVDGVLAANTLPHVFAFGHLPAFKANHTDCLDDFPANRDAFWNSLRAANARAYFAGHDHFYDRARIDDGDGNADDDVHQVIVGTGGAPFHTSYTYNGSNTPWTPVNQFHEGQYGYVLVEIDGARATLTFYHRTAPGAYAAAESWTYTAGGAPVAVASANPVSGIAPLVVQFDGSGSYDPGGSISSFAWTFGDGGSSSLASPSYTYNVKGLFTATLTVTDNSGLSDSSSLVITVNDPPAAALMHVGDLDGSRTVNKKGWTAKVAIAVHDSAHRPVPGAVVTGRWGTTGATASCRIGTKGTCSVSVSSIPVATVELSFTVTNVARTGVTYAPAANHDADGDSTGTVIVVRR